MLVWGLGRSEGLRSLWTVMVTLLARGPVMRRVDHWLLLLTGMVTALLIMQVLLLYLMMERWLPRLLLDFVVQG